MKHFHRQRVSRICRRTRNARRIVVILRKKEQDLLMQVILYV